MSVFRSSRSRKTIPVVEGPVEQKLMPPRCHCFGARELASGSACYLELMLEHL